MLFHSVGTVCDGAETHSVTIVVLSHPGLASLFGIHRCLLVESKDGRHHYAAHSSTAKIRASRQAGGQHRGRHPRDPSSDLLFFMGTIPYIKQFSLHVIKDLMASVL